MRWRRVGGRRSKGARIECLCRRLGEREVSWGFLWQGGRTRERGMKARTWGADEDDAGCFGELHWGCLIDGETEGPVGVVVKKVIISIVSCRVAENDNNGPPVSVLRL